MMTSSGEGCKDNKIRLKTKCDFGDLAVSLDTGEAKKTFADESWIGETHSDLKNNGEGEENPIAHME